MVKTWQKTLTDLDNDVSIKWLAGFFEGEGSIVASISKKKELSCGLPDTQIRVQVATTEKSEPTRFKDYFGIGKINRKTYSKDTWMDQWSWDVRGRFALLPLHQLEPHLLGVKKEQAQLALQYIRLGEHNTKPTTKKTATERLKISKKIRSLTQGSGGD